MTGATGADGLLRESTFSTFDASLSLSTLHQRPDRYRHLELDLGGLPRIARGGGYSYVAASFGQGVVVQDMRAFDRVLGEEPGQNIRVEAGMTLARLLRLICDRKLHIPVLPGHPGITVGGCIAADVHGKNPLRDGTFCDWVERMTLFHPARGFTQVSHETDAALFETTCGGLGLTGTIVDATLRLVPRGAAAVEIECRPVRSLAHAADLLLKHRECELAYSWHDGSSRGSSFGRGMAFSGTWRADETSRKRPIGRTVRQWELPTAPVSLWTPLTIAPVNKLFRWLAAMKPRRVVHVTKAAFPFADRPAYHRLYGRQGFAEAQLLVPDESFGDFESALRRLVERVDPALVLMSLKRFRGRQKSCTPSGTGILVALDMARNRTTTPFLRELDALMLDVGAQPNVMKDGRIAQAVAARALPHYADFALRRGRFDPSLVYQSEASRRLGL